MHSVYNKCTGFMATKHCMHLLNVVVLFCTCTWNPFRDESKGWNHLYTTPGNTGKMSGAQKMQSQQLSGIWWSRNMKCATLLVPQRNKIFLWVHHAKNLKKFPLCPLVHQTVQRILHKSQWDARMTTPWIPVYDAALHNPHLIPLCSTRNPLKKIHRTSVVS